MPGRIEQGQSWLQETFARAYKSLRRFYVLDILLDSFESFGKDRMTELAAALAYYGLLALFPLLLVLIALASYFFAESSGINEAIRFAEQYLPGAAQELRQVLTGVVEARGSATVIGILGLIWSASGLFDVLQVAMDRAWRAPTPRAFWQQRLFSIAAIGGLGALFLTSLVVSTATNDAVRFMFGGDRVSLELAGNLFGLAISFVAFAVLYKAFPHAEVRWQPAAVSAFFAALLWELAKHLYEFYLLRLARFNLVYGSVGAIIGLLLWLYISAVIVLFGGEIAAAVARKRASSEE